MILGWVRCNHGVQIEVAVDAVLCLGEIARRVLVELEVMVGATDRGLGVGNEGADPLEDSGAGAPLARRVTRLRSDAARPANRRVTG